MYEIGSMYAEGEGVSQDYAEALKYYRKAAEQGVLPAQNKLGEMYERGRNGVQKNGQEAVKWYSKAAEYNNGDKELDSDESSYVEDSLRSLCRIYTEGKLVAANDSELFKWGKKYADLFDDEQPQFMVALMYYGGKGVRQNYAGALKYFISAANNGSDDAGEFPAKASVGFYSRAASEGNDFAQLLMGLYCIVKCSHTGNLEDLGAAFKWMNKAAKGGNEIAQEFLSEFSGGEENSNAVTRWVMQSAKRGDSITWKILQSMNSND